MKIKRLLVSLILFSVLILASVGAVNAEEDPAPYRSTDLTLSQGIN